MAVTIANILVGAGDLSVSLDGVTFSSLGATMDGAEIAFEPEYGEVEVDQLKDAARLFNQGVNVTLRTNLAEATLENLAVAWGYPASAVAAGAGTKTFSLGVPSEDPVERVIKLVGNAPNSENRTYLGRRCISVDGSTHSLKKSEATAFPVSFRLLPDPAYSGSEYGTIVDAA